MAPSSRELTGKPLELIFAYRVFDLRDRFPQPLETFYEALECLQSERAYMAAMSGEIVAYLRGGYSLTIPEHFFLRRADNDVNIAPPEENDAVCVEVEAWLRETFTKHSDTLAIQDSSIVRPSRFDLLVDECAAQAPGPDTGHEVLDLLNDKNVWAAAIRVFGDKEKAKRWMTSPLTMYEGLSPVEMLHEDPQRVYESLIRIEHGVYS